MSDHNSEGKNRPSHQVSFSAIKGRDDDGKDILGPARQIGAIWPRQGKDGEGILRFDHIPEEMRSGGGVIFTRKLDAIRKERDERQQRAPHSERKARRHDKSRDFEPGR